MTPHFRTSIQLVVGLMPASASKNKLLNLLGWNVATNSHIAPNVFLNVDHVVLGEHAKLRGFNIFRSMRLLELGTYATVGSWNWFSASPEFPRGEDEQRARLIVAEHSAITSRHYADCSGGISIGRFSTIAGQRSTILSHGIDFSQNSQGTARVSIGDFVFVSTNCTLVAGSVILDSTVVGAGAVVSRTVGSVDGAPSLWGGVPARAIKALAGAYFSRTLGSVRPMQDADDSGPERR